MPDTGNQVTNSELYAKLAAPFDREFTDTRGGVEITYVTGEQVVSRLNDALGVGHWAFQVKEHSINAEADEAWVLGQLDAQINGLHVVFGQFGSQKLKRSRSTGAPLDLGFDLKGAATDSLKKCASLLGVGLYLMARVTPQEKAEAKRAEREAGKATGSQSSSAPRATQRGGSATTVGQPSTATGTSATQTRPPTSPSQPRGTGGATSTNAGTSSGATTAVLPQGGTDGPELDPDVISAALEEQAETDASGKGELPTTMSGANGTETTGSITPEDMKGQYCEYCGEQLAATFTVNTTKGPISITRDQAIARSKTVFQGVTLDPVCGEALYDKNPLAVKWFKEQGKKVNW